MKKIAIAAVCLMFILQSCYKDYKFDFEHTSTYFSYQYPLRTLVVEKDKDLTFDFGVVLGGKRSNDKEEFVDYEIDPSLLSEYPDLKLLPEDRYTLSGEEGRITIPSGELTGKVTVSLDKEWFLEQEDAVDPVYALPLQIIEHTTDSVTYGKDYSIIVVRYYNEFHGLYWLNGADTEYNFVGDAVEDVVVYSNDDEVIKGYEKIELTTKNETTLLANYIGKENVGNYSMNFDIRKDDGLVTITPDASSLIKELSGTGYYDVQDRALYLDYTYYNDGIKHEVADTLMYIDTYLEFEQWND